MKRHEHRQAQRDAHRKPLPPLRDPDLCDVCAEKIAEGALCRTLVDLNGHLPTLYGHADCIDKVIARNVEHGGRDLGEIGGGPRP